MLKRYAYRREKTRQRYKLRGVSVLLLLMLLFFGILLTGCQTQPIQPCVNPAIPSPPVPRMEPPSQSYSASAQADMETWQKRLTDGVTRP